MLIKKTTTRTLLVIISFLAITALWLWYQQTHWEQYAGLNQQPSTTTLELQESAVDLQQQSAIYQQQWDQAQQHIINQLIQASSTATSSIGINEASKAALLRAWNQHTSSASTTTTTEQ